MFTNTLSLLTLAGAASAHMSMFYPAPLGGDPSINKQSTVHDDQFNYPLGCCGADGPTKPSPGICRGHLDRFDVEEASVTWQAGEDAHFQLTDFNYDPNAPGSTHSGGSCQAGFSVDKGKTWKVAASYHGNCPKAGESGKPEAQTFDFKVPTGIPEGDALFAWIWLNREHEAFMNCAKVKIGSGGSSSPSVPSSPSESGTTTTPPTQSGAPDSGSPPDSDEDASNPGPQVPEDEDENEDSAPPAVTSRPPRPTGTGRPRGRPSSTTAYQARPTSSWGNKENDAVSSKPWWNHGHAEVDEDAREYNVDDMTCECRRGLDAKRCFCDSDDASPEKRAATEKKALRLHRRTYYKRVDACDWASAPPMEVSYYTSDAKCAPNAKLNAPASDTFELKWNVNCGVVEGGSDYPLQTMECGMYGA